MQKEEKRGFRLKGDKKIFFLSFGKSNLEKFSKKRKEINFFFFFFKINRIRKKRKEKKINA